MSGEMDKRRIQVHVGTAEDMGQRFIDAWRWAERGEPLQFVSSPNGLDATTRTCTKMSSV